MNTNILFLRLDKLKSLLLAFLLCFVFQIMEAQVPYVFKNTSSVNKLSYTNDQIYIYTQLGMPGMNGYFNTKTGNWENINTAPTFKGPNGANYTDANIRLSDLPINSKGQHYLSIPKNSSGRIYIGFGAPVYTVGANNPLLDAPSNPNYNTKIETIELTYGGQIFTNTSRVDRYAYPMGEELYCSNGAYYDKVGETVTHEQVIAKWKIFVNDEFQNSYDPLRDIITQMGHTPYFQVGNPGEDYFDAFIDQLFAYYQTRTLIAQWGGVVRTATISGTTMTWSDGTVFQRSDFVSEAFIGAGAGSKFNNGIGQILGVCLNRGCVQLTTAIQVWDNPANFFKNPIKNDYTHFFHSDFVSFEGKTYALAYDDVFDQSSTQSCQGVPDSVVVSLGGFGTEHTQNLTDVYITPLHPKVDQYKTIQLQANGLDQGLIDMDIPSNATINWSVKDPSQNVANDLISSTGLFGPASVTGNYTVFLEVTVNGTIYRDTTTLTVEPAGSSAQICTGPVGTKANYKLEVIGQRVYLSLEPLSTWTNGGTVQLFYGKNPALNTMGSNVLIPNQRFYLDGFFFGDEVYFYIFSSQNGGTPNNAPVHVQSLGTCKGLDVKEAIINITTVQNVTIESTQTYQINVSGITNKNNTVTYPNALFTSPPVFLGAGVNASGLFTPPGTGSFPIKITYDGIVIQTTIVVTSKDCFSTVDLGSNLEICSGTSKNISLPKTLTNIQWTGTASAFLDDATIASPVFVSNQAANYTLNVSGKDASNCTATGSLSILVKENPTVSLIYEVSLCENTNSTTIQATVNPSGGTGVWTNATKVSETEASFPVQGLGDFEIDYEYTSNGCSASAKANIEVKAQSPQVLASNVTEVFSKITNQANVPQLCGTGQDLAWYPSADMSAAPLSSANCYTTVFKDIAPKEGKMDIGEYVYYVTQNIDGCESTPTEVKLIVMDCFAQNPQDATIDLGSNLEICSGTSKTISLPKTLTNIQWTGTASAFLDDVTIASPVFVSNQAVNYTLTVSGKDASNCTATGSLSILVKENPTTSLTYEASLCENTSSTTIKATVNPSGGTGVWTNATKFSETEASFPIQGLGDFEIDYVYTSNGCFASAKANIEVKAQSPQVVVSNVTEVFTNITNQVSVPQLCGTGQNLVWYASADMSGAPLSSANCYAPVFKDIAPVDGKMDLGEYVYYVTQNIDGCESSPTEVKLVVVDCPALAPEVSNYHGCEGKEALSLSASGSELYWFLNALENPILGQEAFVGTSWNGHGKTALGIDTVYVAQYDQTLSCFGPFSPISINIHSHPIIELPSVGTICSSTTLVDLDFTPSNATLTGKGVATPNQWIPQFDASKTGITKTGLNLEASQNYGLSTEQGAVCNSTQSFELSVAHVLEPSGTGIEDTVFENIQNIAQLPNLELNTESGIVSEFFVLNASGERINSSSLNSLEMYSEHVSAIGTYEFKVFQVYATCSSDTVISRWEIVPCNTTEPQVEDSRMCFGQALPKLEVQDEGVNYVWTLEDKSTVVSSASILDLALQCESCKGVGTHTFYVSKEAQDSKGNFCRGAQAQVNFTVDSIPSISIADQSICEGTELNLIPSVGSNSSNLVFEWTDLATAQLLSNDSILTLTPLATSEYSLQVKFLNNCLARDTVDVNLVKMPNANLLSTDFLLCAKSKTTLSAELDPTQNYAVQWFFSEDKTSFSPKGNTQNLEADAKGFYQFEVTNFGLCKALSDTFEIKEEKLDLNLSASSKSVIENTSVSLSANSSLANASYVWETPNGKLFAKDIDYVMVDDTRFNLVAKGNKCVDTASVVVLVGRPLLIPNGFSPNGDGKNEVWAIKGLPKIPLSVSIYNRWGALVYEYPLSYSEPWKGVNMQGDELPVATYFYVISSLEDSSLKLNGTVTILR